MRIGAVIVAAGIGSRMGAGMNKVYLPLGDKPILWHTVNAFAKSGCIDSVVVVTGTDDIAKCSEILSDFDMDFTVTSGGATRSESVYNGLIKSDCDIVAIHDGARALITPEKISAVIDDAKKYGAAALGVVPKDTIKIGCDFIESTPERSRLRQIQTPQVFKLCDILSAYDKMFESGETKTDDCAVIEAVGGKIKITDGDYENIKITTPEDLLLASEILKKRKEKRND